MEPGTFAVKFIAVTKNNVAVSKEFEVGTNIVFNGKLIDDCNKNLTLGNVTYELVTGTQDTRRIVANETSTGGSGFILNLSNAFDASLNDTTTNATLNSNQTGLGNFSHVNLTFQINDSLDTATLFFVTAINLTANVPGSIYIFNFTSSKFEFFLTPNSSDAQYNPVK